MPKPGVHCRILVAGAGPVGLLFATLLNRHAGHKLAIRVVDAKLPAAWRPGQLDARVYALSRESQRLLGDAWPAIAARRISPYRRMRVFEGDRPDGQSAIDFDAADIAEPDLGHIVEDSLLRTTLLEQLENSGVELAFGSSFDALEPGAGRVRVSFGDERAEDFDLVVGADGAGSRVRSAAGIDVYRKDYVQRAIVTHVTTDKPHAATAWQRFLPDGPLAFLPLADGRSSVVWTNASAAAERRLALPETEFIAELEAASAGVLGRLGPCTERLAFPLELKHAVRYTQPGVALIGDAAHAVHPLAGQGMNLGLKDAAVLAETIAAALVAGEYPGDEFVLRRYARAQKTHNVAMQLAFDGINELFGRRLPDWLRPLRGAGLTAVNHAPAAKRLLMRRALGVELV
jgi:2-octaprenylphenol hydroxylase